MRIVDSQLHVWSANTPERPWPAGRDKEAQRPYPISKETLLFQMDLAGVERAILVPPSWEGDRNDLALEAAQSHPTRFAVMGRFGLQDPANASLVPAWKSQPGMLGMRFTFHNEHNRHFLTQRTGDWLWPLAQQYDIPIMLLAPGIMPEVARIATLYPRLRLILDHSGLPVHEKAPQAMTDLKNVAALARHANIAVKVSGLPALSTQTYPFRDVHDTVQTLFDAFGPRRTFWGTDLTRMPCTYRECIDMFVEELRWLKGEDLEWVMGRGISAFLEGASE